MPLPAFFATFRTSPVQRVQRPTYAQFEICCSKEARTSAWPSMANGTGSKRGGIILLRLSWTWPVHTKGITRRTSRTGPGARAAISATPPEASAIPFLGVDRPPADGGDPDAFCRPHAMTRVLSQHETAQPRFGAPTANEYATQELAMDLVAVDHAGIVLWPRPGERALSDLWTR